MRNVTQIFMVLSMLVVATACGTKEFKTDTAQGEASVIWTVSHPCQISMQHKEIGGDPFEVDNFDDMEVKEEYKLSLSGLPIGEYHIVATPRDDYEQKDDIEFTLSSGENNPPKIVFVPFNDGSGNQLDLSGTLTVPVLHNNTNTPLSGATVTVGTNGDNLRTCTTTETGICVFTLPPNGNYDVQVRKEGYKDGGLNVSIGVMATEEKPVHLEEEMLPSTLYQQGNLLSNPGDVLNLHGAFFATDTNGDFAGAISDSDITLSVEGDILVVDPADPFVFQVAAGLSSTVTYTWVSAGQTKAFMVLNP